MQHRLLQKWSRSLRKPWRHKVRSLVHGLTRLLAPAITQWQWALRPWSRAVPAGLERPVAITLTSYPPRFGTLALTLKSLLNQSTRADAVVLWVHRPDAALLPSSVTRLCNHGLRISLCDRDLRSYKKIIPALRSEPDRLWVTADDDVWYPRGWLAGLLAGHAEDPTAVVCGRARTVQLDDAGQTLPYNTWPVHTDAQSPGSPLFFTGIGGVLYPPGCFHQDVLDEARFEALCPDADDIWLNWMVRLSERRIRRVGPSLQPITWLSSQHVSLFKRNVRGSGNDECLRRMTQAYGPCLRRPDDSPSA